MRFLEAMGWVSIGVGVLITPVGLWLFDWSWTLVGWSMFTAQGLLWMLADVVADKYNLYRGEG